MLLTHTILYALHAHTDPDLVSYNTLIAAHAKAGQNAEAIAVLQEMQVKVNTITDDNTIHALV
jgi:pentatricopeptide repeat protein